MDDYPTEPHIISPQPKKLKTAKAKTVEDIEIEDRIQRVVVAMQENGITIDSVHQCAVIKDDYRNRCVICRNYQSTSFNGIPHKQLGKFVNGSKPFCFCPFADDASLYHNYIAQQKQCKAEYAKLHKK